ncbi:hypothetical protein [Roseomonas sp. BN140053]|uniref:hypothetical protein n=1 Tax=Roseomonas sp. BN140053 TaxID=3391898 RepID=UPI0039ED6343
MAVAVHIPVRLRLDREAVTGRLPEIEAAVERAVGRALRRSRRATEAAGIAPARRPHPPAIAWTGPAPAGHEAVERAIRLAIARALEVLDEPSPEPAAHRPARERRDARRAYPLGRYLVDSYEGGTALLPVGGGLSGFPRVEWDVENDIPQNLRGLAAWLRAEEVGAGRQVRGGPCGLIALRPWGWELFITTDGFATEEHSRQLSFPVQQVLRARLRGEEVEPVLEPLLPQAGAATLTQTALPPPGEERLALLRAGYGPGLRASVRDELGAAEARADRVMDEAEYEASVERFVEAAVARLSDTIPADRRFLLRLDFGEGTAFQIALREDAASDIGWTGPAQILPITIISYAPLGRGDGAGEGGAGRDAAGGGLEGEGARAGGGGPGGDDGGGSRYGIPGGGEGQGARLFPMLPPGLFTEHMACEPFGGSEADPAELGPLGKRITGMVEELAARLGITPCRWPGTFALMASGAITNFAVAIGRNATAEGTGRSANSPAGQAGNMGRIAFTPSASPGILQLRRLAQAAALCARLTRLLQEVSIGEGARLLSGDYADYPHHWFRDFGYAAWPRLERAVGRIFTAGCQLVMLQLLNTSREQIAARQRNLHAYAPLFQEIMLARLSDLGALTELRDRLANHERARTVQNYVQPVDGWSGAARALAQACTAGEAFTHRPGEAGEIVEEAGVARIRDARGLLWTRTALETAIAQKRGDAESLDPLIQQLSDIPETIAAFRADPTAAERLLRELLADMARRNAEQTAKAQGDELFGLQAAAIQRNAASTQVPGAPYALTGTHLLAHELLGAFFEGDRVWGAGIRDALMNEQAKKRFRLVFEFAALTLLAVLCPPAAFAVGVGLAVAEVAHARARLQLYRGLINPELVLNRAELELQLYVAYVGVALALLPEAGTAARAISLGVRGGMRAGAAVGARLAMRSVLRSANRQITHALSRQLLPTLVQEAATNLLIQHVIEAALGPVLERVQREIALHTAVGGRDGALALIEAIERDAGRRAEAPLPAALLGEEG